MVTEVQDQAAPAVTTITSTILTAAFFSDRRGKDSATLIMEWRDQGPDHPLWDCLMTHVAQHRPAQIQGALQAMAACYERGDYALAGLDGPAFPMVTESAVPGSATVTTNGQDPGLVALHAATTPNEAVVTQVEAAIVAWLYDWYAADDHPALVARIGRDELPDHWSEVEFPAAARPVDIEAGVQRLVAEYAAGNVRPNPAAVRIDLSDMVIPADKPTARPDQLPNQDELGGEVQIGGELRIIKYEGDQIAQSIAAGQKRNDMVLSEGSLARPLPKQPPRETADWLTDYQATRAEFEAALAVATEEDLQVALRVRQVLNMLSYRYDSIEARLDEVRQEARARVVTADPEPPAQPVTTEPPTPLTLADFDDDCRQANQEAAAVFIINALFISPYMAETLTAIAAAYGRLLHDSERLTGERVQLQKLGVCTGSEFYKPLAHGRALYANHGTGDTCPIHGAADGGGRLRKYIGKEDGEEAQAVLAAMKRHARWHELGRELGAVQGRIKDIERPVDAAAKAAGGKQR